MILSNFKTSKTHVDIRAYRLVECLLAGTKHGDPTAASTALRRLKGPADRAEAKAARKPKTTKQKETQDLVAEADAAYSLYIRWKGTQWPEEGCEDKNLRIGYCITCRKLKRWFQLQCGHCIPRGNWGTRHHELNSHPQCTYCNDPARGGGERLKHEDYIVERYGQEWLDRLNHEAKVDAKKPDDKRLKEIAQFYKDKLTDLQNEGK